MRSHERRYDREAISKEIDERIASSAHAFRCSGSGKATFRSAAAARKRAVQIKSANPTATLMRVYECPQCREWHLTSQGARVVGIKYANGPLRYGTPR